MENSCIFAGFSTAAHTGSPKALGHNSAIRESIYFTLRLQNENMALIFALYNQNVQTNEGET
ncbi:hypothetical protein GCM10010913_12060 [Paenibacillus aceti]|uniref:Tn3 transposase DDE domain-containing protein n=1 Tax=Paenibacillus aceti TaxID=1820010 RepID=A0ABQ1VSG0_9BACL|nr:hypothetical protein GCM10010913_12060 [Paenibacillus aceti]